MENSCYLSTLKHIKYRMCLYYYTITIVNAIQHEYNDQPYAVE